MGKVLLADLKSSNFIEVLTELKDEIENSDEPKKVAADIVKSDPNLEKVLFVLNKDKVTDENLLVVLDVIGVILMQLAKDEAYESVAFEVCGSIFSHHREAICSFLSSDSTSEKISTVLYFLTAVMVSGRTAMYKIVSQLSSDLFGFAQLVDTPKCDFRMQLFYFVLAFLNCDDEYCLNKWLLENADFVTCLFKDLNQDPCELVIRLLTTLHQRIVLNDQVQKTSKMRLFLQNNSKFLFKLYFFESNQRDDAQYSKIEKDSIVKMLHPLLMTVFTRINQGVLLHEDLVDGDVSKNVVRNRNMFNVLCGLRNFWLYPESRDIMSSVFDACPAMFQQYKPILYSKNKMEPTYEYFSLFKFFILLIDKSRPWIEIKNNIRLGKTAQRFYISSPLINKQLLVQLRKGQFVLIHLFLKYIMTIYKKATETLTMLDNLSLTKQQLDEARAHIHKELNIYTGTTSEYLNLWNKRLEEINDDIPDWYIEKECPDSLSFFADFVEFFIHYSDVFGHASVRIWISPLTMLRDIFSLSNDHSNTNSRNYKLIIKRLLILLRRDQAIDNFEAFGYFTTIDSEIPEQTFNKDLFPTLIRINLKYRMGKGTPGCPIAQEICDESLFLLNACLNRWGLNLYADHCFTVWLNEIIPQSSEQCIQFLLSAVNKCVDNLFSYLDNALTSLRVDETSNSINLIEEINKVPDDAEIGDNDDVEIDKIEIPFSCLILAAVDILENSGVSSECSSYFSNIVSSYIIHANDPDILVQYLLERKSILNATTQQHLESFVSEVPAPEILVIEKDVVSKLKPLFFIEPDGSASKIATQIFMDINCSEAIIVFRVFLRFIKNEAHKKSGKKKLLIKIFKNLLKHIFSMPNLSSFESVFEYLLKHPYVLMSYKPLSDQSSLNTELSRLLKVTSEKFPHLSPLLRSFLDKLLHQMSTVQLQAISVSHVMAFYSSPVLLYHDFGLIIADLLNDITFPCPEPYAELLNQTIQIYFKKFSRKIPPLRVVSWNYLLEKICSLDSSELTEIDRGLIKNIARLLAKFLDEECLDRFTEDQLLNLIKITSFDAGLCENIIQHKPSLLPSIAQQLNSTKPDLLRHVPLVQILLKRDLGDHDIDGYLKKSKKRMMSWIKDYESENVNGYEDLLEVLIRKGFISTEELTELRNHLYEDFVTNKTNLPLHVLSFRPIFFGDASSSSYDPGASWLFLGILLSGLTSLYGKPKNFSFVSVLADAVLRVVEGMDKELIRKRLFGNALWLSFVKKVLKHGLGDEVNGAKMLDCVSLLIKFVYSKKKKEGKCSLNPYTLLQMARAHSLFVPVMLGDEQKENSIKERLILLQLSLVEVVPKVMEERHVPLLLGAYRASMSVADQALLRILYLYEFHDCMPSYQPTVWGRSAVTHFAIESGPGTRTEYSRPRVIDVLGLLETDKVIKTAYNFDMSLVLEPSSTFNIGGDPELYDQRFLLNLFIHILSDSTGMFRIMNVIQKGAVAIGLAALTSQVSEVWCAGATLLKKIVVSFEMAKKHHYNKLQWMWLVGVVGYGLENKSKRIPSLAVHFLIRATELLHSPSGVMYKPVMNYLYLRPTFQLFKVPEMYQLFFSEHMEDNVEHRRFLLSILASGIRDDLDYEVCRNSFLPKLILGLVTSPTIDSKLKDLTLNVLCSMVRTPSGAQDLIDKLFIHLPLALEPQMHCPVENLTLLMGSVMKIFETFWNTWKTKSLDLIDRFSRRENQLNSQNKRKADSIEDDENLNKSSKKTKLSEKVSKKKYETNKVAQIPAKLVSGCTAFVVGLCRVLPRILSDGSSSFVGRSFDLLSEVVSHSIKLNETKGIQFRNLKFLHDQVKQVLDVNILKQRFATFGYADTMFLFAHESNSDIDWVSLPFEPNSDERLSDEKSMKIAFHKLYELLSNR